LHLGSNPDGMSVQGMTPPMSILKVATPLPCDSLPNLSTEEAPLPLPKDEGIPAAKRPRLQASPLPCDSLPNLSTEEAPLPLPEDEGIPAAKRPRLQAPTNFTTAADGATTDPPDDTTTVPVTLAAPSPSTAASHAPRRPWKLEEDAKLIEAVKKHGKDWVAVATQVPDRTNIQCHHRWNESLDPSNNGKEGKWTVEEDANLIANLNKAMKKDGKKDWVAVAAMVPGRTNTQCKHRWNSLDPSNNGKEGKWKAEEDAKLIEAVKKHGKKWVAAAAMVPGRSDRQCRERWTNILDPSNNEQKGE
jgi:hypothetical protein